MLFLFTENVNILGSDDATTCIIVVLRHSGKCFKNNVNVFEELEHLSAKPGVGI
jgi:hypothetical protein